MPSLCWALCLVFQVFGEFKIKCTTDMSARSRYVNQDVLCQADECL